MIQATQFLESNWQEVLHQLRHLLADVEKDRLDAIVTIHFKDGQIDVRGLGWAAANPMRALGIAMAGAQALSTITTTSNTGLAEAMVEAAERSQLIAKEVPIWNGSGQQGEKHE
jgi:hypothetical protein